MVRFTVDTYSHGVVFRVAYPNDREAILTYCKDLAIFDTVWVPKLKRKVRKAKAVFATASADRTTFGFLRAELPAIMAFLKARGYEDKDFRFTHHQPIEGTPIEVSPKRGVGPRDDEQRLVMKFMTDPEPINRVLNLRTGGGKAQPLTSFIKTPGGWSLMGEMQVGTLVTARDGTPTRVTGVYPQGTEDVYELTFKDGRTTRASSGHLWRVYNSRYRRYGNGSENSKAWTTLTTLDLIKGMEDPLNGYSVPLATPEDGTDSDLPIDPYVLGVLLGDGNLANNAIRVTKADDHIFVKLKGLTKNLDVTLVDATYGDRCRTMGFKSTRGRENKLVNALRDLGLAGCRSFEKFIPNEYLYSSLAQRTALVQGLMDSDGYVDGKSVCSYATSSYELAEAVQYLIRSLGGLASISVKRPNYTHRGESLEGRVAYRISVRHPNPKSLFTLPRKVDRAKEHTQYSASLRLGLSSITYVGKEETQCISVEHPERLYVTDGFTVTHNTAMGLLSVAHYKVRTAFIMSSGHFKTWLDSAKWVLDINHSKDICTVRGREQLVNLVQLALAGQCEYKLIFISIATMRAFLKDHLAEGYTIDGVTPHELFPTLGVGMRIVDESHENIHALVQATIFTHVRRAIYLSATLKTEDEKINQQYAKIFPEKDRFKDGRENDHAKGLSVTYHLKHPEKVKCTGGKGYSHVMFEQWIMKHKEAESLYFDMIETLIEGAFIQDYAPDQRLLIFCATTDICERLVNRLTKQYPEYRCSAYTASYADSVLYENDIVVSTPGSAGTGKDIPNLKTCIATVAVGSVQRNLQMLGRLRPLKDYPEVTPMYIWLTCVDIQQHRDYDQRKREQFAGKCSGIEDLRTNYYI